MECTCQNEFTAYEASQEICEDKRERLSLFISDPRCVSLSLYLTPTCLYELKHTLFSPALSFPATFAALRT